MGDESQLLVAFAGDPGGDGEDLSVVIARLHDAAENDFFFCRQPGKQGVRPPGGDGKHGQLKILFEPVPAVKADAVHPARGVGIVPAHFEVGRNDAQRSGLCQRLIDLSLRDPVVKDPFAGSCLGMLRVVHHQFARGAAGRRRAAAGDDGEGGFIGIGDEALLFRPAGNDFERTAAGELPRFGHDAVAAEGNAVGRMGDLSDVRKTRLAQQRYDKIRGPVEVAAADGALQRVDLQGVFLEACKNAGILHPAQQFREHGAAPFNPRVS